MKLKNIPNLENFDYDEDDEFAPRVQKIRKRADKFERDEFRQERRQDRQFRNEKRKYRGIDDY